MIVHKHSFLKDRSIGITIPKTPSPLAVIHAPPHQKTRKRPAASTIYINVKVL